MNAKRIGDTVAVSGEVTLKEARFFPKWEGTFDFYHTVDLSRGEFTEEEEAHSQCLGYGHSGPVYGRTTIRKVSSLLEFVEDLNAGTVILPSSVTRKQLNACLKNKDIGRFVIPDESTLFSMKDGIIWNKKGTILIHRQAESAELARCAGCGRSFIARRGIPTADGDLVCPDCLMHYGIVDIIGSYLPYEGVCYHKDDPRLAAILAEKGKTVDDYTQEVL